MAARLTVAGAAMKRITLSPDLLSQLRELQEGAFVCDESGQTIGYFAFKSSPAGGLECPHSTEELLKRAAEGGGRTLDEILESLESRS
jgi:hypothetical protein